MHSSTLRGVLEHLRKLTDPDRCRELSDGDLLDRFRLHREESAFTLLLQRHGTMVFNVCRRILGDSPEAEDAFQTAFLVLIRKAGTIRKEAALSSWLHVVATHVAHKAAMQSTRRRACEREAISPQEGINSFDALAAAELRAALDEEVERLPEKYRRSLILCYLAEKTHEQAAHDLGWPKSSVTARLAKARQLLQQRLMRRGFTAPAGLLAVLLTEQSANAAVPSLLTLSTVKLAVQSLSSKTFSATSASALAGSFIKHTTALKATGTLALLAILGLAAVGYRMAVPDSLSPSEPKIKAPAEPRAANSPPRKPRLDLFGDPLPEEAVARMGSSRLRHTGNVRELAFSADGKTLVSGGYNCVRIWDAATGKLRRRFGVSTNWNLSFAFSGEAIIVANAGYEKRIATLQAFDPVSGKVRRRMEMPDRVLTANLRLSRDGKWLAYGHQNSLRLYETVSGREVLRLPLGRDIAFAADGKSVVICDFTDTVRIHDTSSGECTRRLKHEGDQVAEIALSPDGRYLASIPRSDQQRPGELSIWDLQMGKERHRLKGPGNSVLSAAFSPDCKYVAVGCQNTDLLLFDVETGKEVRRYPTDALFASIAFSPDGKKLAAASGEGRICMWETATGRVLPAAADPMLDSVLTLQFSVDGRRLLGQAGLHFAWDAKTGRELRRFPKMSGECYWVATLAPDESLLASADDDGTIHLWDAKEGRKIRDLKGHEKRIWNAIFSADGHRLASSSFDESIHVWDVSSGRELHKLKGGGATTLLLAFSPDGHWLASASNSRGPRGRYEVILWDLTTGREKSRFAMAQDSSAQQLAFSPDSRLLAAVGGGRLRNDPGEVQVWDVTGERQRRWLEGHKSRAASVVFSPDNRMMATGDQSGELFLWELASGRRRHRFVGHESWIYSLAFSPDGGLLAASSSDAPVLVWGMRGTVDLSGRLSDDELRRCWIELSGEDAAAAFEAIRRLAAAPEQTLPFLRQHLKPVPSADRKRVRHLVEALDSSDFPTRQKAAEELEKQADAAASLLREILTKEKPSLEVRRRLQQILEAIDSKPESLRAVRAVEALEWIGTPDAIRLIDELTEGAADARLTREAATAKRRLQR